MKDSYKLKTNNECSLLNVILNMYKSIKSCVMNNGVQSECFDSHVGLRQGKHFSPLLFALFLSDMETFFPEQKWNTLKFIEKLYNYSNDGINVWSMTRHLVCYS